MRKVFICNLKVRFKFLVLLFRIFACLFSGFNKNMIWQIFPDPKYHADNQ